MVLGLLTATATASTQLCCRAMMASCLACSAGITIGEYCDRNPTLWDCPTIRSSCPATAPSPGTSCSRSGLACSYDLVCCASTGQCVNTTHAECSSSSSSWMVAMAAFQCPQASPPPPAIPCTSDSDCDSRSVNRGSTPYCRYASFQTSSKACLGPASIGEACPLWPAEYARPCQSGLECRMEAGAAGAPPPPPDGGVTICRNAPSPPPSPPSPPAVLLTLEAAGTVESFDSDRRATLTAQIASVSGVEARAVVSLTLLAASVRILATIVIPPTQDISLVSARISTALSDAAAASTALGIEVVGTPTVRQTTRDEAARTVEAVRLELEQDASLQQSSGGNTAEGGGGGINFVGLFLGVGGGALVLVVLIALWMWCRYRSPLSATVSSKVAA